MIGRCCNVWILISRLRANTKIEEHLTVLGTYIREKYTVISEHVYLDIQTQM
jgi:hypothetical protein